MIQFVNRQKDAEKAEFGAVYQSGRNYGGIFQTV